MTLSFSLAHMMGGLMLLCAFSLLSQRRLAAMITLYQAEALTLTAAALWQGYVQHSPDLYATALITLVIKAVVLPFGLRQMVLRFNLIRAVDNVMPVGVSMILGLGLIGVAVLVVLPTTPGAVSLTREDLAVALSVVLLGLPGHGGAAQRGGAGDRFSVHRERSCSGRHRHAGHAVRRGVLGRPSGAARLPRGRRVLVPPA